MVALELRETDVTRAADVVFPVAPVTDKAGTFVTWEGRPRPFEAVFANPASLPDLRVLAGIAEELAAARPGSRSGFRTVAEARRADGGARPLGRRARRRCRPARPARHAGPTATPVTACALATWKQMIDNGSMQDGEEPPARHRPPARRPGQPGDVRRPARVGAGRGDPHR